MKPRRVSHPLLAALIASVVAGAWAVSTSASAPSEHGSPGASPAGLEGQATVAGGGRTAARATTSCPATCAHKPTIAFISKPPKKTASTSAKIAWKAGTGSRVRCSLDHRPSVLCSSPKTYRDLKLGLHTLSVIASLGSSSASISTSWTIRKVAVKPAPAPPVTTTSAEPLPKGCFAAPGACGYPDPAYGNVGVAANMVLTPSSGLTTTSDGQVINGLDVTGPILVANKNVTIQNSRITFSGNSGGVVISNGATGTDIKNTTIRGAGTDDPYSIESAVWNHYNMAGTRAEHVYFYNCADCWEGAGTITDSYMIVNGLQAGAHYEDIYVSDASIVANHDTLFNPQQQTAVVFVDTHGGTGGDGDSNLTVTDSLIAGGGWTVYPAAAASSLGTGTMDIERNRFARCKTARVDDSVTGGYACASGPDSSGFWPNGGYFGTRSTGSCPPTPGQVWADNVWDDNNKMVSCAS